LNLDIGRWMWWPSALAQKPDPAPKELSRERAALVPLLREHLDVIAAGVDLPAQHGVAVNAATGRVTVVGSSREIFREQVSLRLANIEGAARRALEVGGEVVIW
jgi:hypothetical protein